LSISLFLVDFDAASGVDTERDSYLAGLWDTMSSELQSIFTCCVGFDENVSDAGSFANYFARCQIETTMSFNDYYVEDPHLPSWPWAEYLIFAVLGAAACLLGFIAKWLFSAAAGLTLIFAGTGTLGIVIWRAYASVIAAGAKPFPAAPDSNLPSVLKALYLQRAFTQFAIENQGLAANASAADQLFAAFGKFLAANRPENLEAPTQPPGIYGI
jgi:hypothetical protein